MNGAVVPTTDLADIFRQAFHCAMHDRTVADPGLAPFAEALAAVRCVPVPAGGAGVVPEGAGGALDAMLDGLGCEAALAEAIRAFSRAIPWHRMLAGAGIGDDLEHGLLVGRPDLPEECAYRLGLFLILPGVHYPLHQHGALELYHVVAGRVTIQHRCTGTGTEVGPGEYSITPPHRVHSLTTGADPCMIAYCWTGDVAAPAWWWAPTPGGWERTRWRRQDSGLWKPAEREAVTEDVRREAGEP